MENRRRRRSETRPTKVWEVVVQLAHDPIDSSLGRAVRVCVDRELRGHRDAPYHGGDGHELGRLALLQQRVRRLK